MGIRISKSEEVVMSILYKEQPLSMHQIVKEVKKNTEWSDSTIKTFVRRLVKKGVVKEEKRNITYFSPMYTDTERVVLSFKELANQFFKGSYSDLLLNFIGSNEISKEELQEIKKMLDEQLKENS